MILPAHQGRRNDPRTDSDPHTCEGLPAELTSLPRWACWRAWHKAGRATREPVHPATGKGLRVSEPDNWATYDEVVGRPAGRKPVDGIGLLVTAADGLAVVLNASADLPARLGPNAVYAEPAVAGNGLTVVVRSGVHGAKTDRFVPLSGRAPYHGHSAEAEGPNPDAIRTESGRPPYQDNGQSGHAPYQESGTNPDNRRTVFSSSLQEDYSRGGEDLIRREVEEFARAICEQGKAGDQGRWVYGLIGVFRRHGLTTQSLPHNLLLIFAEVIGEDADSVRRLVLARWQKWKPHKVPLADALRAIHADPSLLSDLEFVLADRLTLLAAGMCKYMGASGEPFALPGRVLAEVLGLRNQQDGSNVVGVLVELELIRKVKEACYTGKRAAEYVWVRSVVEPVQPPHACPPPPPPPPRASRRPGYSHEQTAEFCFKSRLGGFLTAEHYLAEMMLARRFGREGKDLFDGFWRTEVGKEYARQVATARSLLTNYGVEAVSPTGSSPSTPTSVGWVCAFTRLVTGAAESSCRSISWSATATRRSAIRFCTKSRTHLWARATATTRCGKRSAGKSARSPSDVMAMKSRCQRGGGSRCAPPAHVSTLGTAGPASSQAGTAGHAAEKVANSSGPSKAERQSDHSLERRPLFVDSLLFNCSDILIADIMSGGNELA
jgi:hypothetical protein